MTDIKPEQVPKVSAKAVYELFEPGYLESIGLHPESIIAAALNAWPGKSFEEKHNLLTQTSHTNLVIPLGEA